MSSRDILFLKQRVNSFLQLQRQQILDRQSPLITLSFHLRNARDYHLERLGFKTSSIDTTQNTGSYIKEEVVKPRVSILFYLPIYLYRYIFLFSYVSYSVIIRKLPLKYLIRKGRRKPNRISW